MIGFEEVKCEGHFGAMEGRGVPAHAKKLAVMHIGVTGSVTLAKANPQSIPAIDVDDDE